MINRILKNTHIVLKSSNNKNSQGMLGFVKKCKSNIFIYKSTSF